MSGEPDLPPNGNEIEEFRSRVERRDAAGVRELLQRIPAARALVDATIFAFGGTALCASSDDPAMVAALLDAGADPNRRSDWWAGGFHPLHSATGEAADLLLRAGAIPDACAAAQLDRVELLRTMLDEEPQRVHERGGDGQTPLHFARSRTAVNLLLERGADVDARDVDHRSSPAQWMLERARNRGRYSLAAYLVERGATPDIFLAAALGLHDRLHTMLRDDPSLLELRTGQGGYGEQPPSSYHIYTWTIGPNRSPLQVAAQFEQDEALELLRTFATPMQRFLDACAAPDPDEAHRLLRESARLIDELTEDGHRTLADAAWAPNAPAVELMMSLGFDPAVTGANGGTALHCAAWEASVEGVRAILAHARGRALVNVRDGRFGGTPLGWCLHGAETRRDSQAEYDALARLLIDAGAVQESENQAR